MQMVDQEGPDGKPHTVIESGAMLIYLTDKYGKFITQESIPRYQVVQLLMFQMGNIGPFFGQDHHFRRREEKVLYGTERHTRKHVRSWRAQSAPRSARVSGGGTVHHRRCHHLSLHARSEWQGISLDEFPNIKRWFATI